MPVQFNPSQLDKRWIVFEAKLPANYIAELNGTESGSVGYFFSRFSLQNYFRFDLYRYAPLTIHFQRTSNDAFQQLSIAMESLGDEIGLYDKTVPVPDQLTFNVKTFANQKTYIHWRKMATPLSQSTIRVDSILCVPNANNAITINF